MARFLTDLAVFSCDLNPFPYFNVSENQDTVTVNGHAALTSESRLRLKIPAKPCPQLAQLTNSAQPFCAQQFSPWVSGMDIKHTANGKFLLTGDARCTCLRFGCSIRFSGLDTGDPAVFFSNGRLVSGGVSTGAGSQAASETGPADKSSGNGPNQTAGETASADSTRKEKPSEAPASGKGDQTNNKPEEAAIREDTEEGAKKRYFYACRDCRREDCKIDKDNISKLGGQELEYKNVKWGHLPLEVNCQSQTLSRRYHKAHSEGEEETLAHRAYQEAIRKLEKYPDAWKYAAHHLVSGKQVFAKMQDLVQMAYVCGYDINNYLNCIMLVSNAPGYGEREKGIKQLDGEAAKGMMKEEAKATDAYFAMSIARMQWHAGHHYYSFDKEEAAVIKKALIESCKSVDNRQKEIPSYKEVLEKTLKDLVKCLSIKKPQMPVCPNDFINAMNHVSAYIREKLESFYYDYRASYPWYVSQQSYLFAFGLPMRFRVVTMHVEGGRFLLQKFNLYRYVQGSKDPKRDFLQEDARVKEAGAPIFYDPAHDPPFKCVYFCSNIEHFLFFGKCGPENLPFRPEKEFYRTQENWRNDPEKYLNNNFSEILAWIGNSQEENPKKPVQRIHERMANLKKNTESGI